MASGKETPVPPFLPTSHVMTNGYFGGVSIDSTNLNCVDYEQESVSIRRSLDLGYITSTTIDNDSPLNKYKETELIELSEAKPRYKDMSTQMKEYNINYNGLVIIPWEEFAENPRKLNDLFYLETNGLITYDPEEVNVFFHATKMNKPTFGDISENGKAWVVNVETIRDLEQVRVWLIERVSIFGVTLVKKTSRFGKPDRAPCLVMLDPSMGHGDTIHASIMRCINVMQERKKFCLEIDFNGCVERWCRRITMTKCEAVGAKLVITNGEEPANMSDAENIICCIVCLPIWSIQAGIYKLHRNAQYKDFELKFDAEELFLYGTVGGVRNQRAKLFKDYNKEVFRTKPIEEASQEFQEHTDRHQYTSVKKVTKDGNSENYTYEKYQTTDINNLLTRDNQRLKDTYKYSHSQHEREYPLDKSTVTTEDKCSLQPDYFVKSEAHRSPDSKKSTELNSSGNSDINRLDLRENTNLSETSNSAIVSDAKKDDKIQSMLEIESCTIRKQLSPIQSARTVNSDIMIITQSNDEGSPHGSEIDLRTFLKTELNVTPEKSKKKRKKHKRSSKPPKSPSKKNKNSGKNGVDNTGFESENENKFRRVLPSKRRSLESLNTDDTLESNDRLQTLSSFDSIPTGSRDSIDSILTEQEDLSIDKPLSHNEVKSLNPDTEDEALNLAQEDQTQSEEKVFHVNEKFQKRSRGTENDSSSDDDDINNKKVQYNDMSCDDFDLSDFDDDSKEKSFAVEHIDGSENVTKRTNTSNKPNVMRGTAPYRSNRQKYIGMNTTVKNERFHTFKTK